jgi:hypothetical protein
VRTLRRAWKGESSVEAGEGADKSIPFCDIRGPKRGQRRHKEF